MRKRFFVEILKEICGEDGLKVEIFSSEWLCKITNPRTQKFTWTYGYNFTLNSSVSQHIVNDKVATSVVLTQNNIPVVEHLQIFNSEVRKNMLIETTLDMDIDQVVAKFSFPVVLKPNRGTLGKNVFLCKNKSEIRAAIRVIEVQDSIAVSKFYNSKFEYRFYIFDNTILLTYKKTRSTGGWKHNLSQGARAEICVANEDMQRLALAAFSALNLRFAAVDIFETDEGLKVLEVNGGIVMDKFAEQSTENYQLAKEIHRKLLYAAEWFESVTKI